MLDNVVVLTWVSFFLFCFVLLGSTDVLVEDVDPRLSCKFPNKKFMIMGHRGSGVNILQSSNPRMKGIRENTITSFNEAAKLDIDFIEFDVQVKTLNIPENQCYVFSLVG